MPVHIVTARPATPVLLTYLMSFVYCTAGFPCRRVSHRIAGVGQNVAAYCHAAGPPLRHGRPVVPDHQRDGESPSPASQPGRVIDAELPPKQLPGGRIQNLPGHHEVDGGVSNRQAPEIQDGGQPPVPHQQVFRR
jgi:hypothetical protein